MAGLLFCERTVSTIARALQNNAVNVIHLESWFKLRAATMLRNERIRVAHITTSDISLKYLLLNQLVALRDAGFKVHGISAPGGHARALAEQGIVHIPVPMERKISPSADLVSLYRLYRVLRAHSFTIVHTHTPKAGLLGQIAAKLAGVPIIINTLHGYYFHDHTPTIPKAFYMSIERIAALCSDAILSQNREDIQTALNEGICPPEKIRLLGNGIDIKRFDRARLDFHGGCGIRQRLGIPEGSQVVGFVGRLVAEKGLRVLMKAIPIVHREVPNTRFLFVGPVDTTKKDAFHPSDAEDYGVADVCFFTGMREDMPEMYAAMDLFVLPSYREGFPRSPMEASAMGVPIIVTDIRGCREVVEDGVNGFRVPVGNENELASRIISMLLDPTRLKQMGQNGRTIALTRFDERNVFERVKMEYFRLLGAKGVIKTKDG